jgi:hypothetical protein
MNFSLAWKKYREKRWRREIEAGSEWMFAAISPRLACAMRSSFEWISRHNPCRPSDRMTNANPKKPPTQGSFSFQPTPRPACIGYSRGKRAACALGCAREINRG